MGLVEVVCGGDVRREFGGALSTRKTRTRGRDSR